MPRASLTAGFHAIGAGGERISRFPRAIAGPCCFRSPGCFGQDFLGQAARAVRVADGVELLRPARAWWPAGSPPLSSILEAAGAAGVEPVPPSAVGQRLAGCAERAAAAACRRSRDRAPRSNSIIPASATGAGAAFTGAAFIGWVASKLRPLSDMSESGTFWPAGSDRAAADSAAAGRLCGGGRAEIHVQGRHGLGHGWPVDRAPGSGPVAGARRSECGSSSPSEKSRSRSRSAGPAGVDGGGMACVAAEPKCSARAPPPADAIWAGWPPGRYSGLSGSSPGPSSLLCSHSGPSPRVRRRRCGGEQLEALGVAALGVDLEQLGVDREALRSGAHRLLEDFLGLQVAAVGEVDVGLGDRVDVADRVELARRIAHRRRVPPASWVSMRWPPLAPKNESGCRRLSRNELSPRSFLRCRTPVDAEAAAAATSERADAEHERVVRAGRRGSSALRPAARPACGAAAAAAAAGGRRWRQAPPAPRRPARRRRCTAAAADRGWRRRPGADRRGRRPPTARRGGRRRRAGAAAQHGGAGAGAAAARARRPAPARPSARRRAARPARRAAGAGCRRGAPAAAPAALRCRASSGRSMFLFSSATRALPRPGARARSAILSSALPVPWQRAPLVSVSLSGVGAAGCFLSST